MPLIMGVAGGASLIGGFMQSNAQQNIAEGQLGAARENRDLAVKYAQPTTEELMMQTQQLDQYMRMNSFQQQQLGNIQSQLAAINPQIGEISKQYTAALRGEKTAWMAPIEQQRAHDRSLMEAQVNERMGGGARQSTAGNQAMGSYDYQTGQLLANTQLQGLGALSQMQGNALNAQGALQGQAYSGAQAVSGLGANYQAGQSSIANRMISAINATPTTPYAGAGNIGAGMMGSSLSGLANIGVQYGAQQQSQQNLLDMIKATK